MSLFNKSTKETIVPAGEFTAQAEFKSQLTKLRNIRKYAVSGLYLLGAGALGSDIVTHKFDIGTFDYIQDTIVLIIMGITYKFNRRAKKETTDLEKMCSRVQENVIDVEN